jgi:HSP20 family protein
MVTTATREEPATFSRAINQLMQQMVSGQFDRLHSVGGWCPSVNVYRLERRIEVCVDVAGMQRDTIEVRVEPGRLTIRGVRPAPEPPRTDEAMRIIAMEIDHGPFARVIPLPGEVDLSRVESRYENGMLWIRVPLRGQG